MNQTWPLTPGGEEPAEPAAAPGGSYTGSSAKPRPPRARSDRSGRRRQRDLATLAESLRAESAGGPIARALVKYVISYIGEDEVARTSDCTGAAELADCIRKLVAEGCVITAVHMDEPAAGSPAALP